MCKTSKSTQEVQYPDWVNEAGQFLVGKSKELADQPFEAYTGPRVADFSADQGNAFQQLRDLIANAPQVWQPASDWITKAATAGPQSVSTERVVDEGGRLGAIADYTDPFMQAAEGPVQAAIRKITEAADASRKRIGAGATAAGAFGDARHGVRESQLDRDTSLAIGETAGNLYGKAFSDAMGQRTGDLGRFLQTDLADAQFGETALGRLMSGAGALETGAQADQTRMLQQIASLLQTGGAQQANEQLGLDRNYEEFLREYGHDFNVINALAGALKSTPHESTTTTKQPDNSGIGALGSLAGSALSAPEGSAAATWLLAL